MTPLIFSPEFGLLTLGTLGFIDLIAATTNSFNGILLARSPSHYKHFTIIGVALLGLAGGIGGGTLRDILLNEVPAPLVNPWYLIFCTIIIIVALLISYNAAQDFRRGLFAFVSAFSLPWYAIVGADKAMTHHLGYVAAILIGVIGTTGGRWIIDLSCMKIPQQLVRGEFFVGTAAATALLYIVLHFALGIDVIISTTIAVLFGFGFRLLSQFLGWEEWEPWEPEELKAGEKPHPTLGVEIRKELD
ncbi:MAG: TRIC cation channel family protein [Candidatus Aquilonibacter sp.]